MKYYAIAEVSVTNPAWVTEYLAHVDQIVENYGGRYLARTSQFEIRAVRIYSKRSDGSS